MNYENRIVLFLDILGFKKYIMDTVDKKDGRLIDNDVKIDLLYATLFKMGEIAGLNQDNKQSTVVTQFSDSIVISFKEEERDKAFKTFEVILNIITHLITNKIICRGALSYGKFIHDKNLLFGPALIDAYETESKAAMYPRVIMDKEIYDFARMYNEADRIVIPENISYYLTRDLDGKYYIDYFKAAKFSINNDNQLNEYYKIMREIIDNGLKNQQPDLKVKYGWMREKYNNFLNETKNDIKNDLQRFPKTLKHLANLKPLKR